MYKTTFGKEAFSVSKFSLESWLTKMNLSKYVQYISVMLISLASATMALAAHHESRLSDADQVALKILISSESRSVKARARNQYRHPFATLNFFDLRSDLRVVEIWPGGQGGWYRSILEPYLADNGDYIPVRSKDDFPAPMEKVTDNSADRVLVFRAHGFMIYEHPAQDYFDAIFKMLKPGGVFGIVDHRGDEAVTQDPEAKNGYVNQSHVRLLAKRAGFEFLAESEINANNKDTKNYPNGLYSLPPSLKGSSFDKELRQRVLSIGESDRMTLKFHKPK